MTVCTCSPTLIFLVRAPSGKTAWTWGTRVLLRTPPSGPIKWLSCFIRDTTAKYWGKSRVMMRHILFFSSSSGESSSVKTRNSQYYIYTVWTMELKFRDIWIPYQQLLFGTTVWEDRPLTFIHAIKYLVQFLFCEVTVVFPPTLPCLTPQDHQLSLCASQGCKMRDLHDHRPKTGNTVTSNTKWTNTFFWCLGWIKHDPTKKEQPSKETNLRYIKKQTKI